MGLLLSSIYILSSDSKLLFIGGDDLYTAHAADSHMNCSIWVTPKNQDKGNGV